jgi:hypothetical protein
MRYFTPKNIEEELNANGFETIDVVCGFGTDGADETTFGVIARPMPSHST